MNYQSIIGVHSFIGFFALLSFWVAAFAKKGGKIHRLAGKFYLASMVVILASIIPMIISKWQTGDLPFCVLLGFLFTIAFTASLITWQSIQKKNSAERYFGISIKISSAVLFCYGLVILGLGIVTGTFLQFVFSSVGLVLGGSVWLSFWKKERPKKWFLAQHMNGVAVNFAATHGSFFRFGLASFLPISDSPELNTMAQTSMIVLALVLRLLLARTYLK